MLTSFLGTSSSSCSSWLHGQVVNAHAAGGHESKELSVKILGDEDIKKALGEVGTTKVLTKCGILLSARAQVVKLSTMKSKLHMNKELSLAVSSLKQAGLMVPCSWKKRGSTGYAATCFVKVPAPAGDLVQLKYRNFLRKMFGVADADHFFCV